MGHTKAVEQIAFGAGCRKQSRLVEAAVKKVVWLSGFCLTLSVNVGFII
jgi:hypothetical protein